MVVNGCTNCIYAMCSKHNTITRVLCIMMCDPNFGIQRLVSSPKYNNYEEYSVA